MNTELGPQIPPSAGISTVPLTNPPTSLVSTTFEEQMKIIQQTIRHNEEQSNQRFINLGTTIKDLVTSNEVRLHQIQLMGQVQSQACMMGIQELANKLQLQISNSEELVERAKDNLLNLQIQSRLERLQY